MMDREKVIKGLELCKAGRCNSECPYSHINFGCRKQLDDDAIAMLKEQNDNIGHWVVLENCSNAGVYCSECHTKIFDRYPMKKKYSYFCPHCGTRMEGQEVK